MIPLLGDGRQRVVIENIQPCIDGGCFPAKRIIGDRVRVEADVFADGHDRITAILRYRSSEAASWAESAMTPMVNDRWVGEFVVEELGTWEFALSAWVDRYETWRRDLLKKVEAGQDVATDLLIGAELLEEAADRCEGSDGQVLRRTVGLLRGTDSQARRARVAMGAEIVTLMLKWGPREFVAESGILRIWVDRERAGFSSWYELFPRSASPELARHGTFRDVEARLPYVASMGFDVLYLPPIHPIGRSFRKGRNNTTAAQPDDVGSPWAIGGPEGGHKAVHPALGTLDDFDHLVAAAARHDIEIALDIAFQCSPDHPHVKEHPEWFRHRPDGSIQYAENPPKKYQDIYPFDFECEDWESLWQELLSVVLFWMDHDIRIFRVDNPHTKALPFWEWLIAEVHRREPAVIFLCEAFTRPKIMYRLAKLGFTQSYTYFAWRNQPWEISQYFTELTRMPIVDFFRPNAWPNTPDILTEYLQNGGRAAAMARVALAGTLCANYGIYGPAFELLERTPREPGSEEYRDSEKYERRVWDLGRSDSLRDFIGRVNRIRREQPALQQDRTLVFHPVNNPTLVCYSKRAVSAPVDEVGNFAGSVLCIVNTDPFHTQAGTVDLNLEALGVAGGNRFQVHDLLTDARYEWRDSRNYVVLDPSVCPAHIFHVQRHVRTERDFEYYL